MFGTTGKKRFAIQSSQDVVRVPKQAGLHQTRRSGSPLRSSINEQKEKTLFGFMLFFSRIHFSEVMQIK